MATTTPTEPAQPADATDEPTGPAPLGPVRRAVREIGLELITLGVIVLLFVAYQLFGTNLTEARNQSQLSKQFNTAISQVPTTTAPSPTPTKPVVQVDALPSVPPGGAIDHLVIPAIHVDKYVVEGTGEADLRRGPGHYPGTAYPGQAGNAAIAGHRTTYGAPFFELNALKKGDLIRITDLNNRTWDYIVDRSEVVSPNDVAVLDPTPFAQLTLTTCNPRFSASSRLVVTARLKGRASAVKVTSPPSANIAKVLPGDGTANPGPALASTNLGNGQSGAWLPSLLYGLLVVALWVAARLAINRTRRWWRLAAYVVGIGLALIPLWFTFENVVLLLPQSI